MNIRLRNRKAVHRVSMSVICEGHDAYTTKCCDREYIFTHKDWAIPTKKPVTCKVCIKSLLSGKKG
jgi:hypothetical protein